MFPSEKLFDSGALDETPGSGWTSALAGLTRGRRRQRCRPWQCWLLSIFETNIQTKLRSRNHSFNNLRDAINSVVRFYSTFDNVLIVED